MASPTPSPLPSVQNLWLQQWNDGTFAASRYASADINLPLASAYIRHIRGDESAGALEFWLAFIALFLLLLLTLALVPSPLDGYFPCCWRGRQLPPQGLVLRHKRLLSSVHQLLFWESDGLLKLVDVAKSLSLLYVLLNAGQLTVMQCQVPTVLQLSGWQPPYVNSIPSTSGMYFARGNDALGMAQLLAKYGGNVQAAKAAFAVLHVSVDRLYFRALVLGELASFVVFLCTWSSVDAFARGGKHKKEEDMHPSSSGTRASSSAPEAQGRYRTAFPWIACLISAIMACVWGLFEGQQTQAILLMDSPIPEVIQCYVPYLNITARSFALLHLIMSWLYASQLVVLNASAALAVKGSAHSLAPLASASSGSSGATASAPQHAPMGLSAFSAVGAGAGAASALAGSSLNPMAGSAAAPRQFIRVEDPEGGPPWFAPKNSSDSTESYWHLAELPPGSIVVDQ